MTMIDDTDAEEVSVCDRPFMLRVRLTNEEKASLDQAAEASRVLNGGKRLSRSHLVRTALAKVCRDIGIRSKKAQTSG